MGIGGIAAGYWDTAAGLATHEATESFRLRVGPWPGESLSLQRRGRAGGDVNKGVELGWPERSIGSSIRAWSSSLFMGSNSFRAVGPRAWRDIGRRSGSTLAPLDRSGVDCHFFLEDCRALVCGALDSTAATFAADALWTLPFDGLGCVTDLLVVGLLSHHSNLPPFGGDVGPSLPVLWLFVILRPATAPPLSLCSPGCAVRSVSRGFMVAAVLVQQAGALPVPYPPGGAFCRERERERER